MAWRPYLRALSVFPLRDAAHRAVRYPDTTARRWDYAWTRRRRFRFRDRFVEQLFFLGENGAGLGGEDIFLGGGRLVFVEQKHGGVNRGMRIVHAFGRQLLHDLDAFGGATKHVERKRVSHRDVHVIRDAIVSLLRQAMTIGGVLIDEQREPRVVRGEARLVRRIFVQALGGAVQIRQVVARAVNPKKRVERFPPHWRVSRHP